MANGIYTFVYDANGTRFQLQGFTAASATGLVPANNLSDVSNPAQSFANITPSGIVLPFAGGTAPTGWLLCGGQAVSRTTYSALFAAIGTAYGAGDGSTTFNVPDLRGTAIIGKDDMGGTAANRVTSGVSGIAATTLGARGGDERLHQHTHAATVTDPGHTHTAAPLLINAGSSGTNVGSSYLATAVGGSATQLGTNPSTTSAATGVTVGNANAGGGSGQNMPPSLVMNYIIKA